MCVVWPPRLPHLHRPEIITKEQVVESQSNVSSKWACLSFHRFRLPSLRPSIPLAPYTLRPAPSPQRRPLNSQLPCPNAVPTNANANVPASIAFHALGDKTEGGPEPPRQFDTLGKKHWTKSTHSRIDGGMGGEAHPLSENASELWSKPFFVKPASLDNYICLRAQNIDWTLYLSIYIYIYIYIFISRCYTPSL